MKGILLFLIIFINTEFVLSQIKNGSFENWIPKYNYNQPEFWTTNQDTIYERILRDTSSVDGNYSLKIVPNISKPTIADCPSHLSIQTSISDTIGKYISLFFHLKLLTLNEDNNTNFFIGGELYSKGAYLGEYKWYTAEEFDEFTELEVPLVYPDIDSMTIFILGGAFDTGVDICNSESITWIDKVYLGASTTTKTSSKPFKNDELLIYPNPSFGNTIKLSGSEGYKYYSIFNLLGQEIISGIIQEEQILVDISGVYILQLRDDEIPKRIRNEKIIVN